MHDQQVINEALPDRLVPIEQRPRLDPAPRLFVASELDYRAGLLHGRWLGMARPNVEVQADLDVMLSRSPTARSRGRPATRWISLAAEGWGAAHVDERLGLARLTELATTIRTDQQAFSAWASVDEGNQAHHLRFPDVYLGHYDSLLEYLGIELDAAGYERIIEAAVPAAFRPYVSIDLPQLARDIAASGELRIMRSPTGGVFLFKEALEDGAAESVVELA